MKWFVTRVWNKLLFPGNIIQTRQEQNKQTFLFCNGGAGDALIGFQPSISDNDVVCILLIPMIKMARKMARN